MKFTGSPSHVSPEALAAIQRRFAGSHSVDLWPKDLYTSLYSTTKWPNATVHKIRDPDLVKGVLVDHADCFGKAPSTLLLLKPVLGEGLITSEGEAWKRQRAIMTPAFKRSAINSLTPFINQATQSAIEALASAPMEAVNVAPAMSRLTYAIIHGFLFGPACSGSMPYAETVNALRVCLDGTAENDPSAVTAATDVLRALATAAIDNRGKKHDAETGLFEMLQEAAQRDQELPSMTATEFRDAILTTIVAGHDTTAVAATWTLFLMGQHPDIQEDVSTEVRGAFPSGEFTADVEKLPLLRRVILEAMRLFPPIPTIARMALQPVTICGVQFDPGDIADILVYPMHRNTLIWKDPERFDPDRFTDDVSRSRSKFAHIPFGAGQRICIGSQLTYLQVSVVLATILRDCTVLPVDGYVPRPQVRVTLQPHDGLPLRFVRRQPAA